MFSQSSDWHVQTKYNRCLFWFACVMFVFIDLTLFDTVAVRPLRSTQHATSLFLCLPHRSLKQHETWCKMSSTVQAAWGIVDNLNEESVASKMSILALSYTCFDSLTSCAWLLEAWNSLKQPLVECKQHGQMRKVTNNFCIPSGLLDSCNFLVSLLAMSSSGVFLSLSKYCNCLGFRHARVAIPVLAVKRRACLQRAWSWVRQVTTTNQKLYDKKKSGRPTKVLLQSPCKTQTRISMHLCLYLGLRDWNHYMVQTCSGIV